VNGNYQLILSPAASQQLQEVPLSLLDEVERQLERLAESPVSMSTRSAFPYRLDRQLCHFSVPDFTGKRWFFIVHFHYGQDEQNLYVAAITVREP
jgi:hypothetical protein